MFRRCFGLRTAVEGEVGFLLALEAIRLRPTYFACRGRHFHSSAHWSLAAASILVEALGSLLVPVGENSGFQKRLGLKLPV